jgi:hypothetical protein
VLRILDERVAADGDNRDLAHSVSWVVGGASRARIPLDVDELDAGRLAGPDRFLADQLLRRAKPAVPVWSA